MLKTEDIIKKGYFPEEIIPPLNTENLASIWPILSSKLASFKRNNSKCAMLSIPKLKTFRRSIGIPNPLHFIRLAELIENNWTAINSFTSGSSFSISPIDVSPSSTRSIVDLDFDNKIHQQIIRSTSSRYLLHIDVTRFYPSIYTHSIPWALHSKTVAKASIRTPTFRTLFGNIIDEAVRNCQDQQTIGIPIGPDTSRVISEIIAVAIDKELVIRDPNLIGLRHIDDYFFYFKSYSELERAKSIIQITIKDYELELNPLKVKIDQLPSVIVEPWVKELRSFNFSASPQKQKNEIIDYFNLAFGYAERYPEDHVIPYAISKLLYVKVDSVNFEIFESLLLKSLMAEPKIIKAVLCLLLQNQSIGNSLNTTRIKETINEFLIYHCGLDNTFEIAWALWLCKSLSISIDILVANMVTKINNSIVALVALDLYNSWLFPHGVNFTLWEGFMDSASLYNENWLLSYEAYIKNWLPRPTNFVETDDFFKELYDNNVQFYEATRQATFRSIPASSSLRSMVVF